MFTTHTVSFCIFDDLEPRYGPVSETFTCDDADLEQQIYESVSKIMQPLIDGEESDPTGYYVKDYTSADTKNITKRLLKSKYYVINRYEKYYVIAFALDYARFEIYSKDCDKELIKWRENDATDPIVSRIANEDYNENPVAKLMKQLSASNRW